MRYALAFVLLVWLGLPTLFILVGTWAFIKQCLGG